jgi:hypothetical protein
MQTFQQYPASVFPEAERDEAGLVQILADNW